MGLPFESVQETCNGGSVQISSWPTRFGRWSGLQVICSKEPMQCHTGVVYDLAVSTNNFLKTVELPSGNGMAFPDHFVSGGAGPLLRDGSRYTSGTPNINTSGLKYAIPLPMISQLCDGPTYLPLGFLSQSSASSLRISLTIPNKEQLLNYTQVVFPKYPNVQNDEIVGLKLFDVVMVLRFIRILDPSVLSSLLGSFDRVPVQVGSVTIPSRILVPFYAKQIFHEIFTGPGAKRFRFSISQKNILGVCLRINSTVVDSGQVKNTGSAIPYIKDLLLQTSNSTVLPLTPMSSRSTPGDFIRGDQFSGYVSCRHIFDVWHEYSPAGSSAFQYAASSVNTSQSFTRTDGKNDLFILSARSQPSGWWFSLENFSQSNPSDSSLTDGSFHARGHNSIINDNNLSISFEAIADETGTPIQTDDSYNLEFSVVFLGLLQISRGSITLVQNMVI